jgi:hypothetical protein
MDILDRHEVFEIEVLDKLNSAKLLDPLVFGGGTMLRLFKECDYQTKIAFSRFSTKQVLLKAHSLEQTMKNKIEAFLDRGEIRDCFDIEFMLRRGTAFPELSAKRVNDLRKKTNGFKGKDFKVKLGSIVDNNTRVYYVQNRFSYLIERLSAISSSVER